MDAFWTEIDRILDEIETPPHILDKFDDVAPVSGDNLTRLTYGLLDIRKPPGQLWERVAEMRFNDQTERRTPPPIRSGIIQAGERIK